MERACRADIELAGKLDVKELISREDVANFLAGLANSNLRKGNPIFVRWLYDSRNIKKRLRMIFHQIKFKLG